MRFLVNQLWYGRHPLRWVLFPVSLVYLFVAALRRVFLQRFKQTAVDIPVIVVGNLSVGGVGKTPLVIALAQAFREKGLSVGIVSRGYGAKGYFPREVLVDDSAIEVGDEPLLIRRKTGCPVVIAPKRVDAVQYLQDRFQPQVIISDDGLQHYAMGRAIEIVVIDGLRGLGNGMVLPAGPLRERATRLKTVDLIVVNGGNWPGAYRMDMVIGGVTTLKGQIAVNPAELEQPVAAVAAIGNPERFYNTLKNINISYSAYPFPDHFVFKESDLIFKEKNIVMTEKDAVKCLPFATEQMYVVSVNAVLQHTFWDALWEHKQLKEVLSI